jgi:hypothetical protein
MPAKSSKKTKSSKLPNIFKAILLAAIILPVILSCWWVIQGDINFSSDIARDFLLFSEIEQKGIVLIGPKSSVMGLFHGPAWLYLNFPAYFIGQGNPVIVGWFWILLIALFVVACFYIGKNLFDELTGFLFAAMTSLYMFFHSHDMFNPLGAMFLIPVVFFLVVKYLENYKFKYLIVYCLLIGLLIQFELAIGIPFFILSVPLLLYKLINSKKALHLVALLLVFVPLLNFFVFDLRHDFLITKSIIRYLSPESGNPVKYNYLYMIYDRTKLATINVEILRLDPFFRNAITGAIFIFFLVLQLKDNNHRRIYFLFLYFYMGYFITTLINRGPILYFYFFPFFPLVFLIFSSFSGSRYKKAFLLIFSIIYLLNLHTAFTYIIDSGKQIGYTEESWKFLNSMADKVFSDEKEFGYFVYTPDVIGYAPKYALSYKQRVKRELTGHYFKKMPTTYVVVAPPARDNPYLSYDWWKKERLKIDTGPTSVFEFPNGYKIEKYKLNSEQQKVPFDQGIDPGLNFR